MPPAKKDADEKKQDKTEAIVNEPKPIEFGQETPNWPFFNAQLQWLPEGSA